MHYDFSCNAELKRELIAQRITYKDLAETMYYSIASIKLWLSSPLSVATELLIRNAMQQINDERKREEW